MESNKKGFILFTLARSGSTFVITKLKHHPEVSARAEVFGSLKLPDGEEQSDDGQIRFIRRFFREYKKDLSLEPTKVKGFKVQPLHIQNIPRLAKVLQEYDVCPIFLYRRNKVKQLVSAYRAKQLKVLTEQKLGQAYAHIYKDQMNFGEYDFDKIYINVKHFKKKLNSLQKQEKLFSQLKEKTGSCLDIYYEDMIENKKYFFEVICQKIGIDPTLLQKEDEVLKITQDNLREVIENFDELWNALKGTEFEAQLLS